MASADGGSIRTAWSHQRLREIRQICATQHGGHIAVFALDEFSNVWMLEAPGLNSSRWQPLPNLSRQITERQAQQTAEREAKRIDLSKP